MLERTRACFEARRALRRPRLHETEDDVAPILDGDDEAVRVIIVDMKPDPLLLSRRASHKLLVRPSLVACEDEPLLRIARPVLLNASLERDGGAAHSDAAVLHLEGPGFAVGAGVHVVGGAPEDRGVGGDVQLVVGGTHDQLVVPDADESGLLAPDRADDDASVRELRARAVRGDGDMARCVVSVLIAPFAFA